MMKLLQVWIETESTDKKHIYILKTSAIWLILSAGIFLGYIAEYLSSL